METWSKCPDSSVDRNMIYMKRVDEGNQAKLTFPEHEEKNVEHE